MASGLVWPLGMGSACCIQRPQGHCQARPLWGLQLLTTPWQIPRGQQPTRPQCTDTHCPCSTDSGVLVPSPWQSDRPTGIPTCGHLSPRVQPIHLPLRPLGCPPLPAPHSSPALAGHLMRPGCQPLAPHVSMSSRLRCSVTDGGFSAVGTFDVSRAQAQPGSQPAVSFRPFAQKVPSVPAVVLPHLVQCRPSGFCVGVSRGRLNPDFLASRLEKGPCILPSRVLAVTSRGFGCGRVAEVLVRKLPLPAKRGSSDDDSAVNGPLLGTSSAALHAVAG